MNKLQRAELLKDMAQQAIDSGATSVEQIHRYIADLPFEALERAGLLEPEKLKLRDRQHRTIGMVYDAIRRINKEIGQAISDQFEQLEDGQHIAQVLQRKPPEKQPASAARTAKRRPARNK